MKHRQVCSIIVIVLQFIINLKHNNNNRADMFVFDLVLNYCYVMFSNYCVVQVIVHVFKFYYIIIVL